MELSLSTLDLVIIVIYFVAVLALGLWHSRDDKDAGTDDYFVAGRKLGWFAIGASLFASNISTEHIIGLSADGFRTGFKVGNYEWGATIMLVILGGIFVPFYIGSKVRTMPEFLERRFGLGARLYLATITLLANVLVRISVALYAGSIVIEELFGINMWVAIAVLSVSTVLYTAVGGLRAVVYTDAVQGIVLLVGTTVLTLYALDAVGGWTELRSKLDAEMFSMVRPATDKEMPWTGLLFGVPVLGVWYWCTDQVMVQRVLGAKSVHHARMGTSLAAVLKIFPVFIFVLPGLCARVLFPDIESKAVLPTLIAEFLPVGFKGLVCAALIAALMSSIDSTLNSTGALVSLDLYERFKPNADPKKVVWIGRVTTVVVMGFGIAWVLVVARAESIFQYLQQVQAALSPAVAASFLVGVFWKRANHAGVMSALLLGLLTGVLLLVFEPVPFLVSAGITFGASVVVLVGVSLVTTPPTPEQTASLTWGSVKDVLDAESTPAERRMFRIITTAILLTMAALWYVFA